MSFIKLIQLLLRCLLINSKYKTNYVRHIEIILVNKVIFITLLGCIVGICLKRRGGEFVFFYTDNFDPFLLLLIFLSG